jgi:FkbM family methyltransferase
MRPGRFISLVRTFAKDILATYSIAADARSCFRLTLDFVLSRFIWIVPKRRRNRVREVNFLGDVKIRYRLNKGDLHSIREIWSQEAYRLPFPVTTGVLLDLGANIGMASVWLTKKYKFTRVIAVEPDSSNAALVRENLELNGINGRVLEAAVGPNEPSARFQSSEYSNQGKLSECGSLVPVTTVSTIVETCAVTRLALVKIDIEGSEQSLFDGPLEWLSRTDAIIIEFHPTVVNYPGLTALVSSKGFKYIPAGSSFPGNMDSFTKLN